MNALLEDPNIWRSDMLPFEDAKDPEEESKGDGLEAEQFAE